MRHLLGDAIQPSRDKAAIVAFDATRVRQKPQTHFLKLPFERNPRVGYGKLRQKRLVVKTGLEGCVPFFWQRSRFLRGRTDALFSSFLFSSPLLSSPLRRYRTTISFTPRAHSVVTHIPLILQPITIFYFVCNGCIRYRCNIDIWHLLNALD